jgi:hypothetical protein
MLIYQLLYLFLNIFSVISIMQVVTLRRLDKSIVLFVVTLFLFVLILVIFALLVFVFVLFLVFFLFFLSLLALLLIIALGQPVI